MHFYSETGFYNFIRQIYGNFIQIANFIKKSNTFCYKYAIKMLIGNIMVILGKQMEDSFLHRTVQILCIISAYIYAKIKMHLEQKLSRFQIRNTPFLYNFAKAFETRENGRQKG